LLLYSSNLLLGFSNWPVILLHQQTQSSFLASSSPRHQTKINPHGRGIDNRGGTGCGDGQASHRRGDDAPGSELLWEEALRMVELEALAAERVKELCPRGNNT
jgi:hypothetical protein